MTDKPLLTQCLERQVKHAREYAELIHAWYKDVSEEGDLERLKEFGDSYVRALVTEEVLLRRLKMQLLIDHPTLCVDDNGTSRPLEKSHFREWQPIETAAHIEHNHLIIGRIDDYIFRMWWSNEKDSWCTKNIDGSNLVVRYPTHWMRGPDAPKEGECNENPIF